mmetsp:Transcript_102399/g.298571  ORF Transcript_102399/g.298571 Transcript_102399/m.298571 type:complete len:232 (+) Transcript_102399:1071-1766(+)
MDQLVASLRVVVGDEGLDHAADGDAGGHDALGPHLTPGVPGSLEVAQEAIGAHEAAEAVRALHRDAAGAALALEVLREEVPAADAHAGLADGAQQHLVGLALRGVHDRQGALHVFGPRPALDLLQEGGAGHVVRPQVAGLHVLNEGPDTLAVMADCGVNELVEGHKVGGQRASRPAHLLHGPPRAPQVAGLGEGLDDGVMGHDVCEAGACSFLHSAVRSFHVLADDASVEE